MFTPFPLCAYPESLFRCKYRLAVNCDIAVDRNQQIAASVDNPGFQKICLLGVNLNGNAGQIHFKLLGRYDIDGGEHRACSKGGVKPLLESIGFFLGNSCVRQYAGNILLGQRQRLGLPVLLLLLNQFGYGFMQFLNNVQRALWTQRLG